MRGDGAGLLDTGPAGSHAHFGPGYIGLQTGRREAGGPVCSTLDQRGQIGDQAPRYRSECQAVQDCVQCGGAQEVHGYAATATGEVCVELSHISAIQSASQYPEVAVTNFPQTGKIEYLHRRLPVAPTHRATG